MRRIGWLMVMAACTSGPDDSDVDTTPELTDEIPYDGVDNDNDPSTPDDDLDGDGFDRADECDDADADAFPGNPAGDAWPVDGDCDGASVPFPNLLTESDACDVTVGATSFFVGDFVVDSGQVGGVEVLYLFANDAWAQAQPADAFDCQIAWRVSGTAVGTAFSFDAVLDTDRTTCVAGLVDTFDSTYSVSMSYTDCSGSPCNTTVSFESGAELGPGLFDGTNLGYQSESRCMYF